MRTRDVGARERRAFFRDVSRLYDGAIVNVSIASPAIPPWDEVIAQPLRGVSDDGDDVILHIGAKSGRGLHLAHRIVDVESIRVQETDEGADVEIDINGTDHTRTVVRFLSPVLPELLDPGVE